MFLIYRAIYAVIMAALFPFELMKRPSGGRAIWIREKLGMFKGVATSRQSSIWIHAVSVGETLASVPFIMKLRDVCPEHSIVVSTITDTGRKVARDKLPDDVDVVYLPFDMSSAIRRAIRSLRPSAFIVMETEIWPNIFNEMHRAGLPVIIVNGRISEKSFTGYRKIRFFMGSVLRLVSMLCMQDETYAQRAIEIGADKSSVMVTGNIKFDISPHGTPPEWLNRLNGMVIVAGSTHKGEESLLISSLKSLMDEMGVVKLVLVPRHPNRAGEVAAIAGDAGIKYVMRSEIDNHSGELPPIVIVDTIGELFQIYSRADIAVMGGSFIEHGGQNPLEPAYWGRAILCGPHMENFPFIQEFYSADAALSTDGQHMVAALKELISSSGRRDEMGQRAREVFKKNAGAVDRTVDAVASLLRCR